MNPAELLVRVRKGERAKENQKHSRCKHFMLRKLTFRKT